MYSQNDETQKSSPIVTYFENHSEMAIARQARSTIRGLCFIFFLLPGKSSEIKKLSREKLFQNRRIG